jgi:hypothetical protein
MRNDPIGLKEKRNKRFPTEYYFANILLSFYFLALGPSNIDFPPQFTPEINIRSFIQFPDPPCPSYPWLGYGFFQGMISATRTHTLGQPVTFTRGFLVPVTIPSGYGYGLSLRQTRTRATGTTGFYLV